MFINRLTSLRYLSLSSSLQLLRFPCSQSADLTITFWRFFCSISAPSRPWYWSSSVATLRSEGVSWSLLTSIFSDSLSMLFLPIKWPGKIEDDEIQIIVSSRCNLNAMRMGVGVEGGCQCIQTGHYSGFWNEITDQTYSSLVLGEP